MTNRAPECLRGLATVARVDDAKDIRDKADAQGMNAVLVYDAACQALASAKATDEVREIRDRAQALRAYARQAKNRQLELDATEIRIRAERRIGELMAAQRDGVGLNVGARGNPGGRGAPIVRDGDGPAHPTLADAGPSPGAVLLLLRPRLQGLPPALPGDRPHPVALATVVI